MSRELPAVLMLAALAAPELVAQSRAADEYVRAEMARQRIPGLALAVVKDGKLVKAQAYGLANVELQVPASLDTVFEIASITKPFTAQAIMLLVESGKLSLDESVSRYLEKPPDSWKAITVRALLTHTSGLPRDPFPLAKNATRVDYEKDEILAKAEELPLLFNPGAAFSYSNLGYYLLGHIIERVSGQTYREFLEARIFKPLGMDATRLNDRHAVILNRAAGYDWIGDPGGLRVAEYQSPSLYAPAGGILSTVLDMAKWEAWFQADRLLGRQSIERMLEPAGLANGTSTGYGFGWNVDYHRGHKCWNHSGGIRGFRSAFLHYPQYRLTIVILCNLWPAEPERMAQRIAGFYAADLTPLADLAEQEDPEPKLTGELFAALVELSKGQGAPILTREFSGLFSGWPDRVDMVGKDVKYLRRFSFVAEDRDLAPNLFRPGGLTRRMWHCRLLTESATRYYSFSLTENNKVCWLEIQPAS